MLELIKTNDVHKLRNQNLINLRNDRAGEESEVTMSREENMILEMDTTAISSFLEQIDSVLNPKFLFYSCAMREAKGLFGYQLLLKTKN